MRLGANVRDGVAPGAWEAVICDAAGLGDMADKPNFLVIFGDDIGIPQISAYTMG